MKAYDLKARGLADIASAGALHVMCIAFPGLALAQPVLLSGEVLRDAVLGATVEIDTPIGTTVPVKIGTDGSLNGEAGSVAFILGSSHDEGRWWIEKGQLCQRWTTWFHGDKRCLRIMRDGNKIAWERDDGETGTATLHPRPSQVAAQAAAGPAEGPRSALGGPPPGPEAPATVTAPEPPNEIATPAPVAAPAAPAARSTAPAPMTNVGVKAPAKAHAKVKVAVKEKSLKPAPVVTSFWVNGVAADDTLNVRQGPSADTAVVGQIPPNSHGVYIAGGCVGLWCPVRFDKLSGWVNRSYLVFEVPNGANEKGPAAGRALPTPETLQRASVVTR